MKTYHFGQLVPTINVYAYPRTGSHFFFYCLSGLFDLISLPHSYLFHQEAAERERELNPEALYTLGLRDPKVPQAPIFFNPLSTGTHGMPEASEFPAVILIRDPVATAYSRFLVERDRWGGLTSLTKDWLSSEFSQYCDFYRQAMDILETQKERALLMRWEDSVAGPEALERLVAFTGHPAKLRPSFVWAATRFENFVGAGDRTFYRSGSNQAWQEDANWVDMLSGMEAPLFNHFGYPTIAERLNALRSHIAA